MYQVIDRTIFFKYFLVILVILSGMCTDRNFGILRWISIGYWIWKVSVIFRRMQIAYTFDDSNFI